jgi:uncharacterized protein YsxB (DUF464 family)
MVKIRLYVSEENEYIGFQMKGHAGFAESGKDIVCAAVSVLVINMINSIETFTKDIFQCDIHKTKDVVSFRFQEDQVSPQARLLMDSCVMGLYAIQDEYGKNYLTIKKEKRK